MSEARISSGLSSKTMHAVRLVRGMRWVLDFRWRLGGDFAVFRPVSGIVVGGSALIGRGCRDTPSRMYSIFLSIAHDAAVNGVLVSSKYRLR